MDGNDNIVNREALAEAIRRITEMQRRNAMNRQPIATPTPTPMAMLADLVQPVEAPIVQGAQMVTSPIRGFYNWLGQKANRVTSLDPRDIGYYTKDPSEAAGL